MSHVHLQCRSQVEMNPSGAKAICGWELSKDKLACALREGGRGGWRTLSPSLSP